MFHKRPALDAVASEVKVAKTILSLQSRVYFLTYCAYGILHMCRKSYVSMKMKMVEEAGFDPMLLSMMDTVFMLCYAIGSFKSGSIGDIYPPNTIVAIGLFGSAACVLLLSVLVWVQLEVDSQRPLVWSIPVLLWGLHGLLQSTGGPVNTAIMSNWFGSRNRGFVFGTWTSHQYMGNIVALVITVLVLSSDPTLWTFSLVISAAFACVWGFICTLLLPERPENIYAQADLSRNQYLHRRGLYFPLRPHGLLDADDGNSQPSINFVDAIKIPNVLGYCLSFGLFKFVNYAIFFWLPMYLAQYFNAQESNLVSIVYDVGMIPGGIIVGSLSDMYGGRRACVIATFTTLLVPFLYTFATVGTSDTLSVPEIMVLLTVVGCLISGPINIITSAVAVDISEDPAICGKNDLMAVTGFINGSGSVIASLGLMIVGPLQQHSGWRSVWYMMSICTVAGTLLLTPAIRKELLWTDQEESRLLTTTSVLRTGSRRS